MSEQAAVGYSVLAGLLVVLGCEAWRLTRGGGRRWRSAYPWTGKALVALGLVAVLWLWTTIAPLPLFPSTSAWPCDGRPAVGECARVERPTSAQP